MTGAALAAPVAALTPVSLDALGAWASLQVRVDRKYVVDPGVVTGIVADLWHNLSVLDIDGCRSFAYESVYFDTPDDRSYRDAAHGRRRRGKVRTRIYTESQLCTLEVKRRSGRQETVKERLHYRVADHGLLTEEGKVFVAALLPSLDVGALRPALTTSYQRTTLLDRTSGARITCDARLTCAAPDGAAVDLDGHVVVETKSSGPPTTVDHLLWAGGIRPVAMSKYCVGRAALDPTLPANKWHRTLRTYFG